jgi:hypothetical protein
LQLLVLVGDRPLLPVFMAEVAASGDTVGVAIADMIVVAVGAAAAVADSRHVAIAIDGASGHKYAAGGRAVGGAYEAACVGSRPVVAPTARGHKALDVGTSASIGM